MLLDVMPGHGRENLMHELEMGDAAVCSPTPESVVGSVDVFLASRPRTSDRPGVSPAAFDKEFCDALVRVGVRLGDEAG